MEADKSGKTVLTTRDVAEIFGVTADAVRIWCDTRKVPFFRTPGGQLRFDRSKIEALRDRLTPSDAA
ncbi:MAG: helix-turn-helix domain-containing protein [Candidatus Microthrix sp.]|nr:helix-turn-helix domain-containing protein [Candidatus Microthrix sp.]